MKKKLLEYSRMADGRTLIKINSSSLSLMQECQRKADYIINHGLVSVSSPAQDFGTLVHRTLADWYIAEKSRRTDQFMTERWAHHVETMGYVPREGDEKKTRETGLKAMLKYAEVFTNDELEVLMVDGKPAAELEISTMLHENDKFRIELFGTLDLIVKNKQGQIYVMDHKTTTALGQGWMGLWNPNHQITGYVVLAKSLGLDVRSALIQGIQVVKTKQEVMRIETERTDEQIVDYTATVVAECVRFFSNKQVGFYPGASDYTCSGMGVCQFQDLCQVGHELRRSMIAGRKALLEKESTDGRTQVAAG